MSRLRSPLTIGSVIVAAVAAVAVLAPVVAPYGPYTLAGSSLEGPSSRHLLGTNDIGQDVFSQLVWGARSSLVVALAAAFLLAAVGTLVGVGAALLGGAVDTVAMRVVDVLLAIPGIPLIVVIAALAGPGRGVAVLVIGLVGWPSVARTVRAQTLALRERGFVAAARGFGGGPLYVLRRHLVPALGPVIVSAFLTWLPAAILLEAGLAFLGLGDPVEVSWGLMLNRALNYQGLYFTPVWVWLVLPAGLAITTTVVGFTFVGVGLEPHFNRRLRHA